ncbi:hypothetical protein KC678_05080 [Candidatus Dojkabacteria bacterium]|uniref:Ribosomal RNA adenine methylase transferase N-terminal domain-containing protein n=1 Tax=Candidatus Dojkabacteria bacterium TaxID=2099670 RepID=A0A955RH36_9BACT|nr:hypothetical protein [Candidatus Dojkabacteria bacterium]
MQIRNHFFKKEFGQNFLRNKKVASKLVSILDITPSDLVVEIGPGDGFITQEIELITTNYIGVEVDSELIPSLENNFKNLKFLNSDFLKINFETFLEDNGYEKDTKVKFIGNLPFNVSKDIISGIFHSTTNLAADSASFIIQEEVSQSFVSKPPQMSPIAAVANIYAEVKKYETIAKKYFDPSPKVAGGMILFTIKDDIPTSAMNIEKLIKIGFSSPRKTLLNNIKNSNKYINVEDAFDKTGLGLNARAAELNTAQWIKLEKSLVS